MSRPMRNAVQNFLDDESGAILVDWVVLTAAIVGLAIVVFAPISRETQDLSEDTALVIDEVDAAFMSQ